MQSYNLHPQVNGTKSGYAALIAEYINNAVEHARSEHAKYLLDLEEHLLTQQPLSAKELAEQEQKLIERLAKANTDLENAQKLTEQLKNELAKETAGWGRMLEEIQQYTKIIDEHSVLQATVSIVSKVAKIYLNH